MRLLIVEDDDVLARLLRDNLLYEGFGVECVADGASAIEIVRTRRPDLVLLDIALPGMNGFESALRSVRDRVPIIIITPRSERQDKSTGWGSGQTTT